MQRWIEQYLGIPNTAEGEGTSWRLLWEVPWAGWGPAWVGWAVLAAFVAMVVWVILRDARQAPTRGRLLLVGLRLSVLALVLLFLCRPVLSVNRTVDPVLVVLIDTSESMGLLDEYETAETATAVQNLLQDADLSEPSRLNLARAVLLRDEGRFLRDLLRSHKLRIYQFADAATLVTDGEIRSDAEVPRVLDSIRDLKASGTQTRPGSAVRQVLEEMKGAPPSGMIVLSDGIATGVSERNQGRLSDAADLARENDVALWTVGIGSKKAARDVELVDVQTVETAYLLDPLNFECLVKATGYAGKTGRLRLSLRQEQTELASAELVLGADGEIARGELTWQPDRAGEVEFAIEIEPLPGETDPANNRVLRKVRIREEPLKVLLADRQPRFEYRYLKHYLERESSVELDALLLEADVENALQDRSAQNLAGRFPVREDQLNAYDVIVLGDIAPADLGPGVVDLLEKFVSEKGKSLLLIAGPTAMPQAYRGTPLEKLLPVALGGPGVATPERWQTAGFRPRPTVAGLKGTPAFRWQTGEQDAAAIWESLPPWYRLFPFPELKPGAIVWLTTEPPAPDQPPLPLLIEQRYGAGTVLLQATDAMWRLRFLSADRFYGRYWLQTLRYLTRSADSGAAVPQLTTDRRVYERGEPVEIRLRIPADGAPAQVVGPRIAIDGPQAFEIELQPADDHPELFTASVDRLPVGSYQLRFQQTGGVGASADFRVEMPQQEMKNRNLDERDLRQASERTGGRYLSAGEAGRLPQMLPAGQVITLEALAPQPLWNRWELLTLFFVLLTAEWLLRKRYQLI